MPGLSDIPAVMPLGISYMLDGDRWKPRKLKPEDLVTPVTVVSEGVEYGGGLGKAL